VSECGREGELHSCALWGSVRSLSPVSSSLEHGCIGRARHGGQSAHRRQEGRRLIGLQALGARSAELPACSARGEAQWWAACSLPTLKRRAGSSECSAALRSRHLASGAPSPVSTCSEQAPSQFPVHECEAAARESGANHQQNRGASFGSGDVVRASSDQVDDIGIIRRLGAGARRHARQLGQRERKIETSRRTPATARPSSRVKSKLDSGSVGDGHEARVDSPGPPP